VVKNDWRALEGQLEGIRARHVAAEGLRGVRPEVGVVVPRDAGGLAGHRPIRDLNGTGGLLLGGKRHFDLCHGPLYRACAPSRLEQEVATDLHHRASGRRCLEVRALDARRTRSRGDEGQWRLPVRRRDGRAGAIQRLVDKVEVNGCPPGADAPVAVQGSRIGRWARQAAGIARDTRRTSGRTPRRPSAATCRARIPSSLSFERAQSFFTTRLDFTLRSPALPNFERAFTVGRLQLTRIELKEGTT